TSIATAGTLTTVNDTAPTTDNFNLAAVEILPAISTNVTVSLPPGTVQDDVMIATIGFRPSSATITAPAGWTLVRRTGSSNSLATYWHAATASEAQNYTWSLSTTIGAVGSIASFAGVDTGTPIDVENGVNTSSSLNQTAPSVTTTVAKAMIVTAHTFSSAATWSPPAGLVEATDVSSQTPPTNNGQSMEVNYGIKTAAGATGTFTAVASNTAAVGNTEPIALRPAPPQYYSVGMPDGTPSRSVGASGADASATTNNSSRTSTAALTFIRSEGSSGAVVAEASVQSWDSANVVLNWTTNDSASTVVHYLALGGSHVSSQLVESTTGTGTGLRPVTGVGFRPAVVFHAHAGVQQVAAPP